MIRFNPYKSDKPNKDSLLKNITLQQMIIKGSIWCCWLFWFYNHKDEARKQRYIDRHKKIEYKNWNKSGIDTPSFGVDFYCGIYQQ